MASPWIVAARSLIPRETVCRALRLRAVAWEVVRHSPASDGSGRYRAAVRAACGHHAAGRRSRTRPPLGLWSGRVASHWGGDRGDAPHVFDQAPRPVIAGLWPRVCRDETGRRRRMQPASRPFLACTLLSSCDVKTLYLRNVPDEVVERLRRLAAREGVSVTVIAVRELAMASARADNPALLGALPEHGIDMGGIVADLEVERAQR